jgi:hypothetical protein
MIPDGIKDRFELYRKWFKTLLIKEFMNLPSRFQKSFIVMIERFLDDCRKIYEEGKAVQERLIELTVIDKFLNTKDPDNSLIIYCTSPELRHKVTISLTNYKTEPKVGSKIHSTIYSIDGEKWFSSKEELIKKLKT